MTKELNQFNTYEVFEPQHAKDLLDNDKKKALLSLIFLRQKKNGAVKARSCANGNPQREHIAKKEAAAPTVYWSGCSSPRRLMQRRTEK